MPSYYQTGSGYCYKKYANGKSVRVSRQEYQARVGGGMIGGGSVCTGCGLGASTVQLGAGMYQLGGDLAFYQQGGGQPKGAGVIFIEPFFNQKTNKYQWAVVLIESKRKTGSQFEDLGGKVDPKHATKNPKNPAAQAASEEVQEESRNLLEIGAYDIFKKSLKIDYNQYRCYFMQLESGLKLGRQFRTNKKALDANKAPYSWRETTNITRVYLSEFTPAKLKQQGDIYVKDVYGKTVKIFGRTKACIREGQKEIQAVKNFPKHKILKVSNTTKHTKGWKKGTTTFTLK